MKKIMSFIIALVIMMTPIESLAYAGKADPCPPTFYYTTVDAGEAMNITISDMYIGNEGSYVSLKSLVRELNRFESNDWKLTVDKKKKEFKMYSNYNGITAMYKVGSDTVPVKYKIGDVGQDSTKYYYNKELCGFVMTPQLINGIPYIPVKFINSLGYGMVYDPEDYGLYIVSGDSEVMSALYQVQNEFGYDETNMWNWYFDPYVDFLCYSPDWPTWSNSLDEWVQESLDTGNYESYEDFSNQVDQNMEDYYSQYPDAVG